MLSSSELSELLGPWVSWVETWMIYYSETTEPRIEELAQSAWGTSAPDPVELHPHNTYNRARKVSTCGPGNTLLEQTCL